MSATKTFSWFKRTCPGGAENNVYFPRLAVCTLFFLPSIFSTERREIVFFLSGVRTGDRRWMCDSQRQKDESWQPSCLTARRTRRIFLSQMAPCGHLNSRQMEFELKWKVPSFQFCSYFSFFLGLCQRPPAVSVRLSRIVYNTPLAITVPLVWKEKLGAEQTGYVFSGFVTRAWRWRTTLWNGTWQHGGSGFRTWRKR